MKLSETAILNSTFDIDSKKFKRKPLLNKISYLAFKMGWLSSRTF
ncbi:hypothetical protein PQO03_05280 [Lentisphaera profundi]|uniref:Uncharacterized protein n=1 Tax=Lentisphaera profundi TaxID=1658616 RepID=A0ABY7VZ91_9BACT|nr:hypothetical protein [Lentisphaera profundi]WDE97363.1 hypothetical protein PQO03_05280 [Lentisphaera profundi]